MPEALVMLSSRILIGFIRALQTGQMRPYYRALKEGFSEDIQYEALPPRVSQHLQTFKQHNNVFHHLKGTFRYN